MKTKRNRPASLAAAHGSLASSDRLTNYWLKHYLHPKHKLCSLCGNSGVIDTTKTAISAAGVHAGERNFCICPNGRTMRAANDQTEPTAGAAEDSETETTPHPKHS